MEKIIYTRESDGGLNVIIPASKADLERVLGPLTDEQYEQHVWQKSIPEDAITPTSIADSGIPTDREFRDAWVQNGGIINIKMDIVIPIHMNRIREMRQKKFEEMGFPQRLNPQVEAAILDEPTRTELQRLRDIPQTLDLTVAKTPDEIKALWPIGVNMHPIYVK
jgi:hypothetical protein